VTGQSADRWTQNNRQTMTDTERLTDRQTDRQTGGTDVSIRGGAVSAHIMDFSCMHHV